ncbi:hypothetical protein CDV55_102292 [Aspergillus turcosus]|nr:hypothetical protein CDV55_102292 [Aspergillus turcosus]
MKLKLNAILLFSLAGLGLATPVTTDEKVLATRGNNTAFDNDGSLVAHPPCMPNGDCPRNYGCRNGWCWCLPYHTRDCYGPPPNM